MLLPMNVLIGREPDPARLRAIHAHSKTDPRSAMEDYKKLVEQGSTLAMLYLGYLNRSGGDLGEARRRFREAYEHGSVECALNLGFIEKNDNSWAAAQPWFAIAADNDDGTGMYYLAIALLSQGQYGSKSDEIVRLLEEASKRGSIRARNKLGRIYMSAKRGLTRIPVGMSLFLTSFLVAAREAWRDPQSRRLW